MNFKEETKIKSTVKSEEIRNSSILDRMNKKKYSSISNYARFMNKNKIGGEIEDLASNHDKYLY